MFYERAGYQHYLLSAFKALPFEATLGWGSITWLSLVSETSNSNTYKGLEKLVYTCYCLRQGLVVAFVSPLGHTKTKPFGEIQGAHEPDGPFYSPEPR